MSSVDSGKTVPAWWRGIGIMSILAIIYLVCPRDDGRSPQPNQGSGAPAPVAPDAPVSTAALAQARAEAAERARAEAAERARAEAVEDVMKRVNSSHSAHASKKPSDWLIAMSADLRRISTSGCPSDFREAYQRYQNAIEAAAASDADGPQNFLDGMLLGAMNALGGELDGGASRSVRERTALLKGIRSTWAELKAVAVRHGAQFQSSSRFP
jgi:hypothetical protein